jgi:murein DD-endopeptidase MepM/ murein hydrolase activator NlpD
MARTKYRYNPITCKYEPWYLRGKELRGRTITFVCLAFFLAIAGFAVFIHHTGSINELLLSRKNGSLIFEGEIIQKRLAVDQERLSAFVDKDDNNYRVILDSTPLPSEVRNAGIGGSTKIDLSEIGNYPQLLTNYERLENLKHQLDVEIQSYDELKSIAENKMHMWASRPAIQPISNKQLDRLHMSYGARLHPIFHVFMDHKGLDFSASKGTPVYATGDGKISMTYFSASYGNVIYIDHGYGYETRYAHLSAFEVTPGQRVKRGQVIGLVGSTGNSVSSHLHYEVLFKGTHVHPINFFQRDLNNKEYEKLIEIGSQQYHPLD